MAKFYMSIRPIDGKSRKVIVDETGKVANRNPSKDELKGLEKEPCTNMRGQKGILKYTNEELLNKLRQFENKEGRVPKEKDFENNHKYPCCNTYIKRFGNWNNSLKLAGIYIEKNEKNYINDNMIKYGIEDDLLGVISHDDIKDIIRMEKERKRFTKHNGKYQKKKTDCRNGNLNPNSSLGKGYVSEILVAKFLGIKTCFDLTDNFSYPKYDMFEHEDWGIINVKGSSPIRRENNSYWGFSTRKNTRPDFFFCIGYDENRKHVEIVYIIPNEHYVSAIEGIHIPCNGNSKWDIFKEREDEVKKWDDLFHTLKLENCPVLRHDSICISETHNKNGDKKDGHNESDSSANNCE